MKLNAVRRLCLRMGMLVVLNYERTVSEVNKRRTAGFKSLFVFELVLIRFTQRLNQHVG